MDEIAEAVAAATRPAEPWRVGTVTSISGTQVVVSVSGTTYTLPRLLSYTAPATGDVVQIAWPEGRPFVLGKIA